MANILIVDDDPDLLKLLALRLKYEGHEVVQADSAEAALARLDHVMPQLLITDLRMGGLDGLALFERVQRRNPLLPVLILTGHGSIPDAVQATQRGVFGYLTKPFEASALMAEVDRALLASQALGVGCGVSQQAPADAWRQAILTRSPRMEQLLSEAYLLAQSDVSILIHGESGTGKELLAQAIHAASARNAQPMVAVNCGAIPDNLIESELFGHTKGAFTGAVRDQPGLFVSAHRGTLFLDEIGDFPLATQVTLLRALQEREVRPVGSSRAVKVDVRVISASHKRLEDEVAAGRFREDLFYRLNVVSLHLPALSERREDIAPLALHFLQTLARRYGKTVTGFAAGSLELLGTAHWAGNIRQLHNVVEKCVVLSTTPQVPLVLVQRALSLQQGPLAEMRSFDEARREFERDYLCQLMKITCGNVTQAARLAQRNRTDFYALLGRHQIDPAHFKSAS